MADLRKGELKILKALYSGKNTAFNELHEAIGLSTPILSKYLKDFQKNGLVTRNIDTRKYSITESGKKAFDTQEIITTALSLKALDFEEPREFGGNIAVCFLGETRIVETQMPEAVGLPQVKEGDLSGYFQTAIGGALTFVYNAFITSIYSILFQQIPKIKPDSEKKIEQIIEILESKRITSKQADNVENLLQKIFPKGRAMIIFSFEGEKLPQALTKLLESEHGKNLLKKILTGEAIDNWKDVSKNIKGMEKELKDAAK
ncbi:winged helix-turn-helix transcriptional regulator [Thermoproteota archaeon]